MHGLSFPMSCGSLRVQVRILYRRHRSPMVLFTAHADVYGPKYRLLSCFMSRENRTRGYSSVTVTLMNGYVLSSVSMVL